MMNVMDIYLYIDIDIDKLFVRNYIKNLCYKYRPNLHQKYKSQLARNEIHLEEWERIRIIHIHYFINHYFINQLPVHN